LFLRSAYWTCGLTRQSSYLHKHQCTIPILSCLCRGKASTSYGRSKMIFGYITFSISICFISWLFAIFVNGLLIKTSFYDSLSNFNFVRSKVLNTILFVSIVKWLIANTFFKYFNQSIRLQGNNVSLIELRNEMTAAEISHLIGFIFVMFFAVYKSLVESPLLGLTIMFFNLLMNLCPSLIQQQNKRRIDRVLRRKRLS